MRVAIWGNLTLHSFSPQVQRETYMTHFMVRHQLISTHEDVKYTSTERCAYINVYVCKFGCQVKILCMHPQAQTCMGADTEYSPYLHVCMETLFPYELNRLIERGRWLRWEQGEEKQLKWQPNGQWCSRALDETFTGLIIARPYHDDTPGVMTHQDSQEHVKFQCDLLMGV